MKKLQEEFLYELQNAPKSTAAGYAELYKKYSELAIEKELNNGAHEVQAKAMGNYYTVSVLRDFINNESQLTRIIALKETY